MRLHVGTFSSKAPLSSLKQMHPDGQSSRVLRWSWLYEGLAPIDSVGG